MKNKPTISVIVVTHNRIRQLARCVASILNNTELPKELIIIDDSDPEYVSAPALPTWKKQTSVSLIYRRVYPKRGVSYSRNLGIRVATGDIVAFIDDDCVADSHWIASVITAHTHLPHINGITGLILPLHRDTYWSRVLSCFHFDTELVPHETDFLFGANYSFKRVIFEKKIVSFNEQMTYSEDRFISFLLRQKGMSLWYDPSIRVAHEYRGTLFSVLARWYEYGTSDFLFWKKTPEYHEARDADYYRMPPRIGTLFTSLVRNLKQSVGYARHFGKVTGDVSVVPGVLLIYLAYYTGVWVSWLRAGTT